MQINIEEYSDTRLGDIRIEADSILKKRLLFTKLQQASNEFNDLTTQVEAETHPWADNGQLPPRSSPLMQRAHMVLSLKERLKDSWPEDRSLDWAEKYIVDLQEEAQAALQGSAPQNKMRLEILCKPRGLSRTSLEFLVSEMGKQKGSQF